MPIAIVQGEDGEDYERCLKELKDKGDARYGICMTAYKKHHIKDPETGRWARKKGHTKDKKGGWIMKEFKGFGDWVEIFRGGRQVDSRGNEHDGDKIIDKAVATFDPGTHEPPVTVGHPKDNAPAFGWVETVRKTAKDGTNMLLAKFRQVVPEFERAVEKGLYKKRSASFYPDGRLRHVGFLGAAPPAVKGLADLNFDDQDEAITFDFYDESIGTIARIFRRLRDWLIEKEGKEKADEIISDWDVEYIREEANQPKLQTEPEAAFSDPLERITDDERQGINDKEVNMSNFKEKLKNVLGFIGVDLAKIPDDALPDAAPKGTAGTIFTEADLDAATKKAAEEAAEAARKEKDAEFAEKERERRRSQREAEISEFCDEGIKAGKILPAWGKLGLKEFMLNLDADEVVEFSEESKSTSFEWFKTFMAELPKAVEFKEVATRDKDMSAGSASEKLDHLVQKKMEDNKELSYTAAFAEVQRENPELTTEYAAEMTQ